MQKCVHCVFVGPQTTQDEYYVYIDIYTWTNKQPTIIHTRKYIYEKYCAHPLVQLYRSCPEKMSPYGCMSGSVLSSQRGPEVWVLLVNSLHLLDEDDRPQRCCSIDEEERISSWNDRSRRPTFERMMFCLEEAPTSIFIIKTRFGGNMLTMKALKVVINFIHSRINTPNTFCSSFGLTADRHHAFW